MLSHPRTFMFISLLFILCVSSSALAQNDISSLSDEMLQERITSIQKSFDRIQTPARWWSWGWIGAYSGITGYGIYGLVSDWPKYKAYNITGVTKTTLSVTLLLALPFYPRFTASEFHQLPGQSREEKIEKLKKGEMLFKRNYYKSLSGVHWLKSHILKISVNLIGGGIVWYFDGWKKALLSSVPGILVAEATILTQPTGQIDDYRKYMKQYYGEQISRRDIDPGWFAAPLPGGFIAGIHF